MKCSTQSTCRSVTAVVLLIGSVLGVAGCGPGSPKSNVSGQVTLNGQPVNGVLEFVDSNGKPEIVPIANGKYVTYALPVGQFKVAVKGAPSTTEGGALPQGTRVPTPPGLEGVKPTVAPPRRYADPEQSGLSIEVKGGDQTFDIPLTP